MKELPILFKGEMSDGILDYRKWQTRRIFKEQPPESCGVIEGPQMFAPLVIKRGEEQPGPDVFGAFSEDGVWSIKCPYGQPGDRLYVKETYWAWGRWETRYDAKKGRDAWHFVDMTRECGKAYQFEQPSPIGTRARVSPAWHKRPSLFMPRHASRITLEVTAVRVERLQEISTDDARAEGIQTWIDSFKDGPHYHENGQLDAYPVSAFSRLWKSINGADSWDANPWVWVVEFRVIKPSEVAA
ncbi:hypothetical protein [Chromohalobacter moromii]|uniref:Morphogenetic protein n=1 Tax=Chromohalobacter moromii TaxID=2860329 RepID=A0A9X2X3S4_9GAMM|nr:hypothetical protein [Chromohalobacter moromii]MCT8506180.1 hypothetical protein [Chromohalobacter moromii]